MLTECESCQEPLTGDAKACSKCGTPNPFFERSRPSPLAMTLLIVGAGALASAIAPLLNTFLSPTAIALLGRTIGVVMAVGLVLLGIFILELARRRISTRRRVFARGKRSLGTVTRSIQYQSSSDRQRDDAAEYSPVVRFTTDAGLSIEFVGESKRAYRWDASSWSNRKQVGKQVEVVYDPENPRIAFEVGRPQPEIALGLLFAIALIVSGVAILSGVLK